jgi:HupE / UreJ protein
MKGPRWKSWACAIVAAILGFGATSARAHEIRPAIVTVTLDPGRQSYDVLVSLNIEAFIAGVGPEHRDTDDAPEAAKYNTLRRLDPDALKHQFSSQSDRWLKSLSLAFDGARMAPVIADVAVPPTGDTSRARISSIRLSGALPMDAKTLRWAYGKDFGSNILRVKRDGQDTIEGGWLKDGQPSGEIALSGGSTKSTAALFAEYASVGFIHIVPKGLDHILFVLGLYLLSTQWRPLFVQVTSFTAAHSITLALGLYGIVSISPSIIEPLIALSIVYVAVENILTANLQPWRPFVVFGFGLLHGLGFAGILQEVGLARADYITGLIGFNAGVELGQLTVILCAWLVSGFWFSHKVWYRRRVVWPASAAIALAGLFWTVERIWFV